VFVSWGEIFWLFQRGSILDCGKRDYEDLGVLVVWVWSLISRVMIYHAVGGSTTTTSSARESNPYLQSEIVLRLASPLSERHTFDCGSISHFKSSPHSCIRLHPHHQDSSRVYPLDAPREINEASLPSPWTPLIFLLSFRHNCTDETPYSE